MHYMWLKTSRLLSYVYAYQSFGWTLSRHADYVYQPHLVGKVVKWMKCRHSKKHQKPIFSYFKVVLKKRIRIPNIVQANFQTKVQTKHSRHISSVIQARQKHQRTTKNGSFAAEEQLSRRLIDFRGLKEATDITCWCLWLRSLFEAIASCSKHANCCFRWWLGAWRHRFCLIPTSPPSASTLDW